MALTWCQGRSLWVTQSHTLLEPSECFQHRQGQFWYPLSNLQPIPLFTLWFGRVKANLIYADDFFSFLST